MLTSEIEIPQIHPYNFRLADVKYLGERSGSNIVNGEIIRYVANLYQVSFEALYSGERTPGPYVGISLGFGSDTAFIIDSDVIGRETKRPRTFQKIEELVVDDRENRKLEVVLKIQVPERLDSITLIPMVWTLDKPLNDYLLSYDLHTSSISDPFTVPVRMYSNIEGGLGIFGSYSRSADTMRVKLPE